MDTRSTILNAAVQVFSQHGFRGSTTRRIADAASVNEVTIFRYFGSKDALLQEAIRGSEPSVFSNPLPSDPKNPLDELTQWCTAVVDPSAFAQLGHPKMHGRDGRASGAKRSRYRSTDSRDE